MSDQNESGRAPQGRRMSLVDMFSGRSNMASSPPSTGVPPAPDNAQHRRGVSISGLGLGGSASGQTSPYNAFAKQRRASISTSSASGSPEFRNSFTDEAAVIEEDDTERSGGAGAPSSPSFGRRLSFGAQALRDVRQSGGAGAPSGGEGFNWSEALRDRSKRPSFTSGNPFAGMNRNKSAAAAVEPPKEMPKPTSPPAKMKKPDHLGERMLRGDFMMD